PPGKPRLKDLPKSQIDSRRAGEWMVCGLEWGDAVIGEAGRAAPHHDVTVFKSQPPYSIRSPFTTPEEHSRDTQRNRDNRRPGIILVAILMKTEFCARHIPINKTGIRTVVCKAGFGGCTRRELEEGKRCRRPRASSFWIQWIVAVSGSVR